MKVLFVTFAGTLNGGANIALKNLLSELKNRDIELYVVSGRGSFVNSLEKEKIPHHTFSHAWAFYWPHLTCIKDFVCAPILLVATLFINLVDTIALSKIIRHEKPDLIVSNSSTILYGYFASRISNVHHIWYMREYLDLDEKVKFHVIPSNKYLRKHFFKNSYTIGITEDVSKHQECIDPNKDFVITDGVMHTFEVQLISHKSNYFLFVGGISDLKGCKDMVKAFCIYAQCHKEYELWFAGSGSSSYIHELINIASKHNVQNRIQFLGFRSDRYDLMSKAQATIVPSHFEGFGFITVEAIMNGSVVIGRNTAGTKLIMDSVEGCELPFMTIEEMATRMEEVLINGFEYYKYRVLKAQSIALKKYSIESCGEQNYNLYMKLFQQMHKQ